MWIIDSKITFKPLLPIIANTIHMHNLSLKSIDWSFENLNLKISSCFLATAHLNIYENSSNESKDSERERTGSLMKVTLKFMKALKLQLMEVAWVISELKMFHIS